MKRETKLKSLLKIKGMPYILLALFAGVALLLISGNEEGAVCTEQKRPTAANYAEDLEKDIEALVKAVDGVKSCTVAITLENGYQYHYAYDQHVNLSYDENGTLTSKQTETAYKTVTADGDTNLVLVKEVMPRVRGVAVVCKGGNNSKAAEIKWLISALLGIEADCIHIENLN